MIYRAIIEEVIDRYSARIRIPLIHRAPIATQYTDTENLPTAKICTLPNTHPNIRVGDVVLVAFENDDFTKPVILGYLYKEVLDNTTISTKLNSLTVDLETKLSYDTSIGDVTPENIYQLVGLKENIKHTFETISYALESLQSRNTGGDINIDADKIEKIQEQLDSISESIDKIDMALTVTVTGDEEGGEFLDGLKLSAGYGILDLSATDNVLIKSESNDVKLYANSVCINDKEIATKEYVDNLIKGVLDSTY